MNNTTLQKAHWSFWIIAIFSLLWNAGGAANFVFQMVQGAEMHPMLSEGQLALIKDRPIWATTGFGVGVIAGLLGCIVLLAKRKLSLTFFIVSFIGVVVVMGHGTLIMSTGITFAISEIVTYFIGQTVLSVFLVWYTVYAIGKGWLR